LFSDDNVNLRWQLVLKSDVKSRGFLQRLVKSNFELLSFAPCRYDSYRKFFAGFEWGKKERNLVQKFERWFGNLVLTLLVVESSIEEEKCLWKNLDRLNKNLVPLAFSVKSKY
jgi:hypothetical protein